MPVSKYYKPFWSLQYDYFLCSSVPYTIVSTRYDPTIALPCDNSVARVAQLTKLICRMLYCKLIM